jgi:hypothetical protein
MQNSIMQDINQAKENDGLLSFQHIFNCLPTWMLLSTVIVSCLCLDSSWNENEAESISFNHVESGDSTRPVSSHRVLLSLLSSTKADIETVTTNGHGFVFFAANLVFIASVHIAAKIICLNQPKQDP